MNAPANLVPVSSADAAAALGRSGRHNPLLGFAGTPAGLPAARLCGVSGSPDPVSPAADLVTAVGAWAGTSERRVAASLVVLGYAARLIGPTLAVMLRDGIVLRAQPDQVLYSYRPALGFRLTLAYPGGWRGSRDALRRRWCDDILGDHLHGLISAVRSVAPVATGLLWGNVASGLAGTLQALSRCGGVPLETCETEGRALLDHGPLRGSGILTVHEGQLQFVRRSCCLYYRLDGGGFCGDCALRTTA